MSDCEDFRSKYTEAGRVGQLLLNRFYHTVGRLVRNCEGHLNSALEIGAGEGFSTEKIRPLLPAAAHFEASEFRADLVELARQRNPGIRLSQESIYSLNRETHSFDLVFCLEVLEHLHDPQAALSELARVSRR